jgi:predicted RNase H-like nuclease
MVSIGIDGCKAGWFIVSLIGSDEWEVRVNQNINAIWETYNKSNIMLIDIPIGFRDKEVEERSCDYLARKKLSSRSSSVFPVPCREAVYSETYELANEKNKKNTGRGLSVQSWNIVKKIKEVDVLLREYPYAREVMKESHPEIGFWALKGKPMDYSKKDRRGFDERVEVLSKQYKHSKEIVDFALNKYLRKEVARDDILDALCLAVNGCIGLRRGFEYIPSSSEVDSQGLEMKITYAKGNNEEKYNS